MRPYHLLVAATLAATTLLPFGSEAQAQPEPPRSQPSASYLVVHHLLTDRGELSLTERQVSELGKLSDRLRLGRGRLRVVHFGGGPGKAGVPRFRWVRQSPSDIRRLAFRIWKPEQRGKAANLLNGLERQ